MTKIKGRCTKNHEPLVARLTSEIQARRLAKLGSQVDAVIDHAAARLIAGDASLCDLKLVLSALRVAERVAGEATAS